MASISDVGVAIGKALADAKFRPVPARKPATGSHKAASGGKAASGKAAKLAGKVKAAKKATKAAKPVRRPKEAAKQASKRAAKPAPRRGGRGMQKPGKSSRSRRLTK
jgi:hypothetical protein